MGKNRLGTMVEPVLDGFLAVSMDMMRCLSEGIKAINNVKLGKIKR